MRFPVYFKRRKGATPADLAVIGSDTAPDITIGSLKNKDNVLSHKQPHPVHRIAVGYWYEGAGSIVTLPVELWVFDETSGKWYQASTGTLTNGKLTYLRLSVLANPPQTSANMDTPSNGFDAMLIVSDNASGDGTLHFVAGPDTAQF